MAVGSLVGELAGERRYQRRTEVANMKVDKVADMEVDKERRYQRRTEVATRGNWGEVGGAANKGRRREQEFWEEHLRRHRTIGLRRHHTLRSSPMEECVNPNVRGKRRTAQQFASLENVSVLMGRELDDWSNDNNTGRKTSRKATILRAESMGHLESRKADELGEKTVKKQKNVGLDPQWKDVGESLKQAREIAEGSSVGSRKSVRRSSRSLRHSTRRTSESFRRDRQLKEAKKRKGVKKMGSLVSRSCSVLRLFSMKRETKEKPKTSFERPKCLRSDSSDNVTQKSEWEGWLRNRRQGFQSLVGRSEPRRSSAWLQPEKHVCQRGANNVTRWEFSTNTTQRMEDSQGAKQIARLPRSKTPSHHG